MFMATMDKAGIVISIIVVVIGVGFAVISSSLVSDTEYKTSKDGKQEMIAEMLMAKKTIEDVKQTAEDVEETLEKGKQSAEEIVKLSKELTTSKLPSRLVSIPEGTAIPGCEEADKCYDPPTLVIFKGGEVIWKNNDNSAHTVTSGNIIEGPDRLFDSGLIMSGDTFSYRFDETGQYSYFCMIHPWAKASVTVK